MRNPHPGKFHTYSAQPDGTERCTVTDCDAVLYPVSQYGYGATAEHVARVDAEVKRQREQSARRLEQSIESAKRAIRASYDTDPTAYAAAERRLARLLARKAGR